MVEIFITAKDRSEHNKALEIRGERRRTYMRTYMRNRRNDVPGLPYPGWKPHMTAKQKRDYHAAYVKAWRIAHPDKAEARRKADYEAHCKRYGIVHRDPNHINQTPYETQKKHRREHPERARARDLINKRIRRGTIVRPESCQSCGKICRVECHHPDYTKPLEIIWLCRKCHRKMPRTK